MYEAGPGATRRPQHHEGVPAPFSLGLQGRSETLPTTPQHQLTAGGGPAPSPRQSLPQKRGKSQSAHSHFESDKPFPRFTLKNKYARLARTGVRKKQRRHGPCQLSGLIYSHSRGTGSGLARGRTQSRQAIPGGKRKLGAGVGTRVTRGMLTESWVVGSASPHFADGETETQRRNSAIQVGPASEPRNPQW